MNSAITEVCDAEAHVLIDLAIDACVYLIGSRRPNAVVNQLQLLRLAAAGERAGRRDRRIEVRRLNEVRLLRRAVKPVGLQRDILPDAIEEDSEAGAHHCLGWLV